MQRETGHKMALPANGKKQKQRQKKERRTGASEGEGNFLLAFALAN